MNDKVEVSSTIKDTFPQVQQAYTSSQPILNEWTNHSAFYAVYPSYYFTFANMWLRKWLAWFDGYVPGIHDGTSGILSTRLATTLCYRLAEQVYGGGLLFSNTKKTKDAKKALEFISGQWNDKCDLDNQMLKTFVLAAAGGTAYTKSNVDNEGNVWVDSWRADQCWTDIDFKGDAIHAKFLIAKFVKTTPTIDGEREDNFYLTEERFIARAHHNKKYRKEFAREIENFTMAPNLEIGKAYTKYNVYRLQGTVNDFSNIGVGRPLNWEEIPDEVRTSIIEQYSTIALNKPQKLPFADIGVDVFKWTTFISNLPQLPYGESLIEKIQTYLFEYDFMNSCMNTDFYLGRGRVLVPKSLQSPKPINFAGTNTANNYNQGLDSFLFTKVDYASTEDKKPEAIQFDLRTQEWVTARNNLIECISTAIGISPSTLASYLNDNSARTAREISSEESATALFVENRRKLFTKPLNTLVKRILLYYGFHDCVGVKFSKSGQTNTTLLTENTVSAYSARLKSEYQAVKDLNPDMSEEELQVEIARIHQDQERQAQQNDNFFGGNDFNDQKGEFGGGITQSNEEQLNEDSEEREPDMADDSDRESTDANQSDNQESNNRRSWLSKLFGRKKKDTANN